MQKIVKTKFVCRTTMSELSRHGPGQYQEVFIEGNTYDGEYETWSWSRGYELNRGWKRYWVVAEDGEIRELPRARFRAVFHYDGGKRFQWFETETLILNPSIIREMKLNQIIK